MEKIEKMNEQEPVSLVGLSRRSFLTTSLLALPTAKLASTTEQNWPEFRGAGARGIADGYPTRVSWNADVTAGKLSGVLWRAEIPGLGHSSPIVWGNRIYVATAVRLSGKAPLRIGYYGDPKAALDIDEQRWMILCFDKKSGKRLWERILRAGKPAATRHEKATHANTTLSTDGKRLVAFLERISVACTASYGRTGWQPVLPQSLNASYKPYMQLKTALVCRLRRWGLGASGSGQIQPPNG
jgi:PQQ-like domain